MHEFYLTKLKKIGIKKKEPIFITKRVEHRIFHIPQMTIIKRREKGLVNENIAKILKEIGWPDKLIKKWQKTVEF